MEKKYVKPEKFAMLRREVVLERWRRERTSIGLYLFALLFGLLAEMVVKLGAAFPTGEHLLLTPEQLPRALVVIAFVIGIAFAGVECLVISTVWNHGGESAIQLSSKLEPAIRAEDEIFSRLGKQGFRDQTVIPAAWHFQLMLADKRTVRAFVEKIAPVWNLLPKGMKPIDLFTRKLDAHESMVLAPEVRKRLLALGVTEIPIYAPLHDEMITVRLL